MLRSKSTSCSSSRSSASAASFLNLRAAAQYSEQPTRSHESVTSTEVTSSSSSAWSLRLRRTFSRIALSRPLLLALASYSC